MEPVREWRQRFLLSRGRLRPGYAVQYSRVCRQGPRRLPGGARGRSCLAVTLGFGFRFQTGKGFFSVNGLHPPAFQVIIAAVERLPNLEHFVKISRHGVLNEVVRSASALRGEVFEFLFGLGGQAYFHAFEDI
jgi:hypothetical protein